ncbi:hypothetical protein B0H16DRAFT_1446826 [Mycena metata]|uniref:Epoxide hydrolase N-terminal domain-containing protein n=1 Tax=Mycena metata TaxID=1033252 RepID=A0AAD7KH85_9AGAR|nr:hypothetical protein B0H16DRAFT_1446826 [Mycena metata]
MLNLAFAAAMVLAVNGAESNYTVKPFKFNLSDKFPRFKSLVENTRLPATPLYPELTGGYDKGVELQALYTEWLTTYDWEAQQAELNQIYMRDHEVRIDTNFTSVIEGLTVHFIHQKSDDSKAIPLINATILTGVSLYYLTDSLSAVWVYRDAQNSGPTGLVRNYTKAPTDAPMFFTQLEYNGFWPEQYVAKVGNLVSYKFHTFGGHFAGLDNPPALIEDIREIGLYPKV